MTRVDYLTMMTDKERTNLIGSCLKHLKIAAEKPMNDAVLLGGLDLVTSLLRWVASFAAIYLLILDRTSWRTNTMTSLLAPYLFISLPPVISLFMRGEFGKWIALCLVVLRLFCPHRFPDTRSLGSSSGGCSELRVIKGFRDLLPFDRLLLFGPTCQIFWWIQKRLH
ncbi:PREDICTED: cold-regulated 413 plasma membrane protein 2-like isoform X3 [Tarenaya hassleriana]|uniref:cold-regulated 413 plasma membrane protein 2-like isoform X3 n=1 Tax=Tarenaya hassleriana TaxID=28532 RepID=UPI00053C5712|nr:PREDICTED: cold-regulated 413 plasma membrane protein 2-like isoform X3 [Tarenaya hassleriana]